MCTYSNDDPIGVTEVARALSGLSYRSFLAYYLRKRVAKTGRWVLAEPKFRKWKKGPSRILWGTGMPGSGKTFLASTIIEHLMTLAQGNKRICVAFAFSRYIDPGTVEDILAGLLRQILEDYPQTIIYIQPMYDYHSLRKTRPSKQELIGVLEAIFTSNLFDEKFCSLDGLDEAKLITQFELLDHLSQLPINLLITSRPLHLLEGKLPMADHFSITIQNSDIESLIEERVLHRPALQYLLAQDEIRKMVVETMMKKASGMFLYATLQLDMLVECANTQELRRALETSPMGLHAMYQMTMLRVEGGEYVATAKRVLTWLVHVLNSMSTNDLQYAIAVDPETFEFNPDRLIDESTLLSVCCGLVTVEPQSKLVRLAHYTAKDFLEPYLKREDPDPHTMIASTCIARLIQSNLHVVNGERDLHAAFNENPPFLRYSFNRWAQHSHLSVSLPAPTRDFVLRCSSFPIHDEDEDIICLGSSVHVAAAFNLHTIFEEWSDPRFHAPDGLQLQLPPPSPIDFGINALSPAGMSALALASFAGHVETVRVLLSVEGIDVGCVDVRGWTPLMRAACVGDEEIVRMLVEVGDTNQAGTRNESGCTALMLASAEGHVEVARALLLVRSASVENLRRRDSTEEVSFISECGEALGEAAWYGHLDVVKMLLSVEGIDVNYTKPETERRTALIVASGWGHKTIVEILLQQEKIDINYASPGGITALACALKCANHDIAELLRANGAQEPSADILRDYIHNDSIPWYDV
ncbi:ankyrin [Coprinopsis marcescibilis]|uniref:Ankyrin n=1 Tax=Coprinopsis marcescibilis TaxID=230819 RepID=A0A5C3KTZ7_COPMA|nr:ankyrin [Coprinopsis marcescibilis]